MLQRLIFRKVLGMEELRLLPAWLGEELGGVQAGGPAVELPGLVPPDILDAPEEFVEEEAEEVEGTSLGSLFGLLRSTIIVADKLMVQSF
jgi:hypothetical protein